MKEILKKLDKNNIEYKVCNKITKHINLYFQDKVVMSYYGTTGTIYSPYVELRQYKGISNLIKIYKAIFDNKAIKQLTNYLLKKQNIKNDLIEDVLSTIYARYYNCSFIHNKEYSKLIEEINRILVDYEVRIDEIEKNR